MKFDTLITNGLIVDGTGARKGFVGDIGIKDGKIASVVEGSSKGAEADTVIDAQGQIVAPGWIDIHTHIDGQITWDASVHPLAANGVTTAVMGNCGVGFAPCPADRRTFLMELMEGVEDIPLGALDTGIKWEWETFPEFLNVLGKKEMSLDVAAFVAHGPIRAQVLGERANFSDRKGGPTNAPVTDEEIQRMAALVKEAIQAGAVGFSSSRTLLHRDRRGILVPGSCASEAEVMAIGHALKDGGGGVFEMASDFTCFDDEPHSDSNHVRRLQHFGREWVWMKRVSLLTPVCFCLGIPSAGPASQAKGFRSMIRMIEEGDADGCHLHSQVFVRPQSILMCWDSLSHPFADCPTYVRSVRKEKKADKKLLADPAIRESIVQEAIHFLTAPDEDSHHGIALPSSCNDDEEGPGNLNCSAGGAGALARMMLKNPGILFKWSEGGEPTREDSAEAVAKAKGCHVAEVVYDWLCEENCSSVLIYMFMNYADKSCEDSLEMLKHPLTVPGLGDAGAHLGFLSDAGVTTYLLTRYVRDTKRLTLEHAVHKHTQACASLFGFHDRGTLEVGKRADINIFRLSDLSIDCPKFIRDLPTGAARWIQETHGYSHTILSGVVTYKDGKPTGSRPGRLVRSAPQQRSEVPWIEQKMLALKWEASYLIIFKFLLPILGAPFLEKIGQMQDSAPLKDYQHGSRRTSRLIGLVAIVVLIVLWRYLS